MNEENLARAQRSGELEIGLQAAVDLDGGVMRADQALAFAPGSQHWENPKTSHEPIVNSHKTQAALIRLFQVRSQFMKLRQGFKVLRQEAAVFDMSGGKHAVRDRLRGNACQHGSPVIESELRHGHNRDRE